MSILPTNNLELALDFSSLTNNTAISDGSGKNNSWIINNATLVANGLNNLTTLRLSGNSSIEPPASISASFFNFLHNSEGHVFLIAKMPSRDNSSITSANYLLFGTYPDENAGPGYRLYVGSSTKYGGSVMTHIARGSLGTYSVELLSLGGVAEETWNLIHIYTNPSSTNASNRGYIELNNTTVSNNVFNLAPSNSNSPISFRILGVDTDGNGEVVGELAELAVYKGPLSSADIENIKTAMVNQWGLPVEIIFPTPTPTPTITPSITPTPTVTPTPSVTPSSPPPQFSTGSSNGLDISGISDFAVDADSLLLYAIKDSNSIDVIDLQDNTTTATISLIDTTLSAQFNSARFTRAASFRAKACAIDEDNNLLYVGSLVSGASYRSAISIVDLNSRAVIDTITNSNPNFGYINRMIFSPKQNKLFLTETYGSDSTIAVDLDTKTYATLFSGGVSDIALDDTNNKLYIAITRGYKLRQYNTTDNSLIGESVADDMRSMILLSNNRLAYTTSNSLRIVDADNISTTLYTYAFSAANFALRSSAYSPHVLTYDADAGILYSFPDRAISNKTKVLMFDVNNYAFKGIYDFPGKVSGYGARKAKFNKKLKKNIALHPSSNKLYIISPDQAITNGSFDDTTLRGSCSNSFTKEGFTSSVSLPGWQISGSSVKISSMSFCNSRDSYNAFINMGASTGTGSVSQSFSTVPDATYTVEFNMGNAPGFNRNTPRMVRVRVTTGSTTLYNQIFTTRSIATGSTYSTLGWEKRSFSFKAIGSTSTITFSSPPSNLSQGGAAIDNVFVSRSTYQDSITITPTPTPQQQDSGLSYLQNNFTSAVNIGSPAYLDVTNDYSGGKTAANVSLSFAGAVNKNRNVYLIPYNSPVIGILYPEQDMKYVDGATHGMGTQAFFGGVTIGADTIFMAPHKATNIGLYSIRNNTFSTGPEVTSMAYAGCVRTANNKIVLVPYNSDTVDIYDIATNTITQGPSHGGPDTAFMGGVLLSNNKVLLVPHSYGQIGIYDPVQNTYTGVAQNDGQFIGGVLSANNNKVILVPYGSSYVGIYDIDSNTYTRGASHSRGAAAFSGGVLLPDGRIVFVPYNSSYAVVYDVTRNRCSSFGPRRGFSSRINNKFVGGVLLRDGTVVFAPHKYTKVGLAEPPNVVNLSPYVVESPHINKI